jgi:hypothetical protein
MSLKHTLFGLTLAALTLAPTLASADEWNRRGGDRDEWAGRGHRHDENCRHGASPVLAPAPRGHYETRTTQRWVEDSYQQIWVEQTCRARPFRRPVCFAGYYEQQLVPGHYENVDEQVWVADTFQPQPQHYATSPGNGGWTARGNLGRVGFRVSGRY